MLILGRAKVGKGGLLVGQNEGRETHTAERTLPRNGRNKERRNQVHIRRLTVIAGICAVLVGSILLLAVAETRTITIGRRRTASGKKGQGRPICRPRAGIAFVSGV